MNSHRPSGNTAIIGMSCRFPGANDIAAFWQNLSRGVESITHFSREELLAEGVDPTILDDPNYVRASPVLDRFDQFDAAFFGYSAREAQFMDPQQRLLHEVAWEAFEDAGYHPETVEGATGVFASAGGVVTSYLIANQQRNSSFPGSTGSMQHIGNDKDFLSTRLSYKLNLSGPSLTIQTACSSSLVALHFACRSIFSGESQLALVGAATVRVPHKSGYLYQKSNILSPDGHCRAFDAKAEGTIFGSGVAAVLLKDLDAARRDGDRIYAVIKSTAINNDGAAKISYTASSVPAQSRAMVEALALSGVEADTISYVECHGTGTAVGDPLEVQALTRAFRAFTKREGFCAIASVKTNVGHLEQTAGLAGLIKAALAIHHAQIPASLNYETPNPKIAFGKTPFFVNTKLRSWEGVQGRRRAAVNALGLGGTNAFAVLEDAAVIPSAQPLSDRPVQILSLSAKDQTALAELSLRMKDRLVSEPDLNLADFCFTANASRSQMPIRSATIARTRDELAQRLGLAAEIPDNSVRTRGTAKRRPLAFLFTGQGSQYPGMSSQLYQTWPQFRQALDRCDDLFRNHLPRPLLEVIFDHDADGRINETRYTQPALFAVEYALAQLWQSFGVVPDAVMGHSVGEFVAACVAGVMSLEAATSLIAARGRLMQQLPSGGSMASVLADEATVARHIAPFRELISIAAFNSPQSLVISGKADAIREVIKSLQDVEVFAKELVVSHAFHSALMDPMLEKLEQVAREIEFRPASIPLVSNLTGRVSDLPPTALYWRQHARGAVQFAKGMETLVELGCESFVEIGPGNTLLGLGRQCQPQVPGEWLASLSRRRDDCEVLLETVGRLFVAGHDINWKAIEGQHPRRRVSLPTYPFRRQRFWIEAETGMPQTASRAPAGAHPLLGGRLRSGLKEVQFETRYGLGELPFLEDHRIYGLPVLPTTAALEAAISGGISLLSFREIELRSVVYREAMIMPEDGSRIVQTIFTPEDDGSLGFRILSTDSSAEDPWASHITGIVAARTPAVPTRPTSNIDELRQRHTVEIPVDRYYRAIAALGLNYGPSFRGIQALWRGEGEALSRVLMPDHVTAEPFELHPAFLDACLHIYPVLVDEYGDFLTAPNELRRTFLPISLERVQFLDRNVKEAWVHAVRRPADDGNRDTMTVDIRVFGNDGREAAFLGGLSLKRLAPEELKPASADAITNWLYQMSWVARPPLAAAAATAGASSRWLLFADRSGTALALAKRLEKLGQHCQMVYLDEGVNQIVAASIIDGIVDAEMTPGHGCRGVIYLWGLERSSVVDATAQSLDEAERTIVGGALTLVRAMSRAGQRSTQMPRLWFITRNSQAVTADSAPVDPLQAMLWGLGRTVAFEHPKFWGGLVDLPAANESGIEANAEALLRECWNPDGEGQVAIRRGGRMAVRFVRLRPGPSHSNPLFRKDASYLITGGLGSLGLKVAQWMAEKGAGQIVLTSRSGARGAAAEAVRDIESKGVRVIVAIGDITKEQDLHRILSEIRATMPRFRGVFHCAGMLDDGVLDQMDWTRFSAVTSPKVKGSWLLHTATAKDELDYFVLFSSILSLFGSAGQSNYASGNAYLDALTQHRRSAGLPAVALNWGPWAETGLATASGSRGEAIWKTRGTRYIPPEEGIKVLELALRRELDHVAVTITSWREFLQQFATPAPFYEELEKEAGPQRKRRRVMDAETTRARIQAVHGRERRELIVEIVRQEAADVLGAEATLDPSQRLGDLGLDSLMSVTLVNRLEPLLAILVPMAKVLAGPSVSELVDSLFPGLEDISTQESEVNVSKVHSNGSANGSAHPHFKRGSEWLVVTKPNPSAALRLFCFPFAGGGSAIYRLWNDTIHPSVEVIAVEPPGRLSRLAQAPVSNIQEFVAEAAKAIVPLLDKPFALFGHCLGTLTMVETARCLKRQKGELPVRMFVSGGRTPDSIHKEGAFERHLQERLLGSSRYDPFLPIHEQSDEVFADIIRLFQIDNTDEMLKSRELRELVLPVVRAEFKMASDYRYSREPVWDCPIICFNGANDAYVTREDILSWSRFTSSSFEAHIRRGGHFLLVDDREFLIRVINRELTAAAQEHIGPKPPRAEAMSVDARPVWTPLNGGHLNMTDSVHR